MTNPALAGFRAATVLNNIYVFNRGQGDFAIDYSTAETRQRAKNATLFTHRLFPQDGSPDRTRKVKITLAWPSLQSPDIDFINGLIAWGGPMTITPWLMETESFWCAAGVPVSGILSRLDAYTTLGAPTGTGTDFQARYGTTPAAADGFATLGTPDTAKNQTPWDVASLTPGTAERIWVAHAPLFTVQIGADQRQFPQASQQGYRVEFEEV